MKNWKTTLAAILAVLPQVLHLVFPNHVSENVATGVTTLFAAGGLAAAKDYNVSGNPPKTIDPK
ncbi:hypothetical protein J3L18_30945 [Mucilaginibacter gossypii]|uniref:hypothetical protein n=1 Tax=Mucilaginibacter gossypii TaxID=551996 RepID=UPI000DCCFACF|nr:MULTISPECIES: hypothetical protein [Mucilaginibacter]QTE37465.1 hypothetical protein J3L18_30945 [Mucilaginibacter gossypii]RAV47480.1 hypothetical protein DIU36_29470 [Mucilaginibacter rubeus]